MPQSILNIAAGKFQPISLHSESPYFLVNLDKMYYQYDKPEDIETAFSDWTKTIDRTFYCNEDAFEFMERTKLQFDKVHIYRFLEHVSFVQLEYFIYLLSTITKLNGDITVIVPNYTILAEMILNDNPYHQKFAAQNITLTTELLNEPSDPHASIWTVDRAKYFFELENRFKVIDINPVYTFDGRDIYMKFIAKRI